MDPLGEDIGDDIDDAWALSALLRDARVDLRLVARCSQGLSGSSRPGVDKD